MHETGGTFAMLGTWELGKDGEGGSGRSMKVVDMVCGSSYDDGGGGRHEEVLFLPACIECRTRHTSMETAYVVL